ncbi:MAG: AAA family ATPase [Desulfamplus sp.]|nr:AAA family ATPase [Desulfamplus sp.]
MRIKHIKVDNFKSLVDFELPLAKFNCIVGLNGSGKTTILQFFDFLSQQVRGKFKEWLNKRHWESSDINSKLTKKLNINFEILLEDSENAEINWSASFNRRTLSSTSERIVWNGNLILKVEDGNYSLWDYDTSADNSERKHAKKDGSEVKLIVSASIGSIEISGPIPFDYQGSIMSQLKESQLPPKIRQLKKFIGEIHSLDLLAPELLRQRTRESGNSLGLGGERLSAFLYEMSPEKRSKILNKMTRCYPNLKGIDISAMRSGWKKLTFQEAFQKHSLKTEARHVADGFLRLLAIFAQLSKEQSFLLLDEIENGINPELIEFMMDSLVEARPQVTVTTHSPMVLNYIEDNVAIEGVVYLYKEKTGKTQAIRLFDIPSMRKKLTVMGPGEVYEDTLLGQLEDEIMSLKDPDQISKNGSR